MASVTALLYLASVCAALLLIWSIVGFVRDPRRARLIRDGQVPDGIKGKPEVFVAKFRATYARPQWLVVSSFLCGAVLLPIGLLLIAISDRPAGEIVARDGWALMLGTGWLLQAVPWVRYKRIRPALGSGF